MTVFSDQALFMTVMGQHLSEANAPLYKELINEEVVRELFTGLDKHFAAPTTENLVEVVDGCIDGIVVIAGLLNCLIGPDKAQAAWEEVQRSNMSKATKNADGTYTVERRADGKVLKGKDYFKPNLFSIVTGIK